VPSEGKYVIEQFKPRRRGTTPAVLDRFERDTGLRIPREYRDFLLCQNGGAPVKRTVTFGKKAYQDTVLRTFFGVSGASNLAIILDIYADRIAPGTFPIASDEFDNLILISQRGETSPILFWDHEKELDRAKPTLVAPNLLTFLAMLKPDRNVEYEIATVTYHDGERHRYAQRGIRFKSVDRNAVVDLRELKIGERIDDFGEVREIVKIEYTREIHPG
jgi:hypothetical protein